MPARGRGKGCRRERPAPVPVPVPMPVPMPPFARRRVIFMRGEPGRSHLGSQVARYRLRFLLQEFDLPRGLTVIGRSLDANLTIEDPLVSRQHARIEVEDEGGTVEDMGSRNGVRVNGVTIRGPTPLKDGDRVRIGTQDFVFCRVDPMGKAHSKTTGVLRLCANCRLPYPREMV